MNHKTEFDAPPLPHTHPMDEPATTFTEARRRYEGTMGSAVVRAANWRLVAFAAIGLSVFLGGGLIYASSRPAAVPYYVDVDSTGAAGLSIVLCKLFFNRPCRTYASRPTCAHPFRVGCAHSTILESSGCSISGRAPAHADRAA